MQQWQVFVLVAIATAVLLEVASSRGWFGASFERVVRCRSGHLFTTIWVPGISLKAVRLGYVRFQRCPVGRHWTLVQRVDESRLASAVIQVARSQHDARIP